MKASALLKQQHDEVKSLFKQLLNGNGHSAAVLDKLANSLAAHMVIEQELFYPAVMKIKEGLVLESYEEHAVARFALKRLMKTPPTDRTFKARVTTLKELIEHHVEEEEEDLFPKAEKELGDSSETLGQQMKALFDKTAKIGYAETVARGGAAVSSASAPLVGEKPRPNESHTSAQK